jgi:hypothetical protein
MSANQSHDLNALTQQELQEQLLRELREHAIRFTLEMELTRQALCGEFDLPNLDTARGEPICAQTHADLD